MADPDPTRASQAARSAPPVRGDSRLGPEDRASLLALIEGDEFLDELDATGDTIHGYDSAS